MKVKENSPQITVLMTVFNGGQYLEGSIRSVLDQAFENFELLIINDASTDGSLEKIQSFDDNRIQIYSNKENIGQAKSLNIGLKLAKGKFVARIDADDFAFPQWLKEQYAYIEKNPQYAVVSTKAVVIDENNRIRRIYDSPVRQEDIILRSFTFSPINHVGCIFNKEVVLNSGGYVEEYKIAADYGLWSNLIRHDFKITSTKKVLIAIRAHSSSFSQSASGARELQDLSDIMRTNINAFTRFQIAPAESKLLCRTFFDEGSLNDAEFHQAGVLLKKVYRSLILSLKINKTSAQKWSDKRCLAAYLKRIYFFIKSRDYASVKDISRKGIDEFGLFNPLGVLFVAYFLSRAFLSYIPALSDKLMSIEAYFITKNKLKTARLL